jgi:hypothetical protein
MPARASFLEHLKSQASMHTWISTVAKACRQPGSPRGLVFSFLWLRPNAGDEHELRMLAERCTLQVMAVQ